MSTFQNHRWIKAGSVAALLTGAATAQAAARTGALQPASPSALQQAQPAFGEKVEPVGPKATAPKRLEPFGLKPATGLGVTVLPALAPTGVHGL